MCIHECVWYVLHLVYKRKGQLCPILENFYIMLKLSTGELDDWIKAEKGSVDHPDVENVQKKS